MAIRLGISSCLLGHPVRFDGGHKRHDFLVDTLGRFVEWIPVCPEVESGLGAPRESMRLVKGGATLRLISARGVDQTDRLRQTAASRIDELVRQRPSGFVLKKDLPSCGVDRVRVYDAAGMAHRTGRGLFAAALGERLPLLPIEDEGRLADPRLRENFVARVYAYQRGCDFFERPWSAGDLVRFHTNQKLSVLAHAPSAYTALGRLVATMSAQPKHEVAARYMQTWMSALAVMATPARHVNVLQHVAGFFKTILAAAARQELHDVIAAYRRGALPLVAPFVLIRHHVREHGLTYLARQTYFEPHPPELGLLSHV